MDGWMNEKMMLDNNCDDMYVVPAIEMMDLLMITWIDEYIDRYRWLMDGFVNDYLNRWIDRYRWLMDG